MFKKHTAVSVLAAIALAAAGCGGDDAGSDTLAKADLAKKANEICVEFNPKVKALGEPDLTDPASTSDYETKYTKIVEDQRAKLGELKPADDVKAEWDDVLAKYDATADALPTLFTAAKAEDTDGVAATAQDISTKGDASDKAFDALGAADCGSKSS